jgi:lysophospholipase L1-like esterase
LLPALIFALVSCSGEEPLGYASLGDSLAAGVGSSAPSRTSYSALYREALEERTGREVEYRQLGLSGETAESFIGRYPEGDSQLLRAESFLQRYPGSRVTLSLGGNDLLRARDASDRRRREAILEYGEDLGFILETLGGASSPSPEITVLTLYNPDPGDFTDRWTGEMNEEIRATARANGASVAEGARAFRGRAEEYLRRYEDGGRDIHPNDAGYAALARSLLRAGGPQARDAETTAGS